MDTPLAEYEQFVRARTPALLRSAYLLTGDQHLAEDLVQDALARTHRAWPTLRAAGNAEAYTRRTMYHLQVTQWRRRRVAESFPGELPEPGAPTDDHAETLSVRIALEQAMSTLSPRQRAVVVLRYLEDRSEAETAELLGVTVNTVKTQTNRALERLRELGPQIADQVQQVDLYERSLRRSSQIGRRRAGIATATGAVVLLLIALLAWQLVPLTGTPPLPPTSPTPTVTSVSPTPGIPSRPATLLENPSFNTATLTFPAWTGLNPACPTGPVTLSDGSYQGSGTTIFVRYGYQARFREDTLVILQVGCIGTTDGKGGDQLVAYRPASGGGYALVGQILRTGPQVHEIGQLSFPAQNDQLGVDVQYRARGESDPSENAIIHQTWTFTWTGSTFRNDSSGRSFVVDDKTLPVTAETGHLVFAPLSGGCRIGTMTLKVTNNSANYLRPLYALMYFTGPGPASTCQLPADQDGQSRLVPLTGIEAGATVEVSVTFVAGEYPDQPEMPPVVDDSANYIQLRTDEMIWVTKYPYVVEYH